MLTISQLATYAGVTVRAIRHYHKIGLLSEPERDHSGYRTYNAAAVVRLIRIHTLADAGVPLARVEELLDADPEEFGEGLADIDRKLRAEIRRLQDTRKRLARLAAGDHLALPQSVLTYLDRLRGLGVDERYIEMERDAWIMIAAQVPHQIDAIIEMKHRQLDDPDTVRLYALLSGLSDWAVDDPRIDEVVDIIEHQMILAVEAGETEVDGLDDPFIKLLDATTFEAAPVMKGILANLEKRGWKGWTRIERVPAAIATRPRGCSETSSSPAEPPIGIPGSCPRTR
jgi:DNA-binding transcriptional MerR regulator